jgi:hypothetical protein
MIAASVMPPVAARGAAPDQQHQRRGEERVVGDEEYVGQRRKRVLDEQHILVDGVDDLAHDGHQQAPG